MRFYVVYDKETGYVHKTGSVSNDFDLANQVTRPERDAVLPHHEHADPNAIRVDLATRTVVSRSTP